MHKIIESKLEDADGDPVESSGPFHWCSEKGEVKIKCGPRRTWTIVNCGLEDLGPPSSCSGEDDSYKSIRGDVIALAQFYPHWLLKAALYWPYFQYPLKCTVTSEFDQRILVKVGGVWKYKQGFCGEETLTFDIIYTGELWGSEPCFEAVNPNYSITYEKCSLSEDNSGECSPPVTCP